MKQIFLSLNDAIAEVINAKLINAYLLIKLGQMDLVKEKLLEIRTLRQAYHYFYSV